MSHRSAPIIIVAAALATAGCGSSGEKPTSPASTTAVANSPFGLYTRTVTKVDIARTAKLRDERGLNKAEMPPPAGRYRLVIAKGAAQGVIKVTDPTGFMVDMEVNVKPGTLQMTSYVNPARAAFCGPAVPGPATYSFRSAGGSLTLRPQKSDQCADRDSLLTGTWARR